MPFNINFFTLSGIECSTVCKQSFKKRRLFYSNSNNNNNNNYNNNNNNNMSKTYLRPNCQIFNKMFGIFDYLLWRISYISVFYGRYIKQNKASFLIKNIFGGIYLFLSILQNSIRGLKILKQYKINFYYTCFSLLMRHS